YAHDEPAHAPATATEESVMSSNGSAPQGSDHSSADRDRTRPDTIIVGAGLAGLVAAHELTRAGRRVLVIDQENRANLGGQAFWSLGGLFLIDSPEQRRLGDAPERVTADCSIAASVDRAEDCWPRAWAGAYRRCAAGEKRQYRRDLGRRVTPIVG